MNIRYTHAKLSRKLIKKMNGNKKKFKAFFSIWEFKSFAHEGYKNFLLYFKKKKKFYSHFSLDFSIIFP